MLVSVAIPAVDRPQLLTEGLHGVVRQHHGWEVVSIDESSNLPLSAYDIRNVIDEWFQLIRHPTSLGVMGTKNVGIRHANGDMCTVRTKFG